MPTNALRGKAEQQSSLNGAPLHQTATRELPGRTAEAAKTTVEVRRVSKQYQRGRKVVHVLQDLDLTIGTGSFEALMGPSGSGKSTLLNIIAGLDTPTSGSVVVGGVNLPSLSEDGRAAWRASNVGFIFQTFNLMPVLTALENVALPLLLTKLSSSERERRAKTALEVVGLAERVHHYPSELSGGQEQRVAIARAIVTDPAIIVADEPTGDLDRHSADEVLELLSTLCKDFGKTVLMVTHDPAAGERASVLHRLDKGSLVRAPGNEPVDPLNLG
jgi:putative ABC transport system ATP-binding protein